MKNRTSRTRAQLGKAKRTGRATNRAQTKAAAARKRLATGRVRKQASSARRNMSTQAKMRRMKSR